MIAQNVDFSVHYFSNRITLYKSSPIPNNFYLTQKDLILKYVVVVAPTRKRKERSRENRTLPKGYYLGNAGGETLNVSNGPINTAIKGADPTGCFSGSDKRGRKVPGNNTSEEDVSLVKEQIKIFPTIERYYIRKQRQKL